jgi:hypothetical protein
MNRAIARTLIEATGAGNVESRPPPEGQASTSTRACRHIAGYFLHTTIFSLGAIPSKP